MWQSGTIRIARISGIPIDIHFTFPLVIVWGAIEGWAQHGSTLSGAAYGVIAMLVLFGCVLIHELAHGLQARALGLVVRRVILLPIGGLAQLEAPASRPWHDLLIALAGPMANLILTAGMGVVLLATDPAALLSPNSLTSLASIPSPQNLPLYLFAVNLSLFLFNMLPAFPMDGGRVLRAGMALVTPYVVATRIAAWVGRGLAVLMCLVGMLVLPVLGSPPNPLLAVVGIIVFTGARDEEIYVRRQWALARVEVGQIFQKKIETVSPWDTLTQPLVARLFKYERILPVIVDERIVGLLGYDEAHRFSNRSQSVTVAHAMRTNFPTLRPRDTLWVALQAMTADHLTMLPVVEGNRFRGVVSLDDIDQAWRLASIR